MYAAIRRYELGSGSLDDALPIVEEGFAAALASQPGFLGYHVVASGASLTGDDEIVTLTFFDDAGGVAQSNEVAAAFVKEHLEAFQLHLTSAMSGPVVLSRETTAPTPV